MYKIILQDARHLRPFNERARDIRIQNKPLWLIQRDILAPFTHGEREIRPGEALPQIGEECILYRDNLFFDAAYIHDFLLAARKMKKPCRAAFPAADPAFREHALPLSTSYTASRGVYLAEMWYFPAGIPEDTDLDTLQEIEPCVLNLQSTEVGYYHIPKYMAFDQGDMVFQVPRRSLLAIDSWVHIFIADVVFGVFSRGARCEDRLAKEPLFKLGILGRAMVEGRQVLECSSLVKVGRDCVIDPRAIIHGPTTIGDHVTINAGAIIENCIIGDNVNISQDCQLMLSVIGDDTFLPFRASAFMSTLMENCLLAQNSCVQMTVIGRNTFIGAGSTFTDFNLLPTPLKALDGSGKLGPSNRQVLGGCVGHNCRLGSGMVVFPARTIESDVVLFASAQRRVIDHDIHYEESDHHRLAFSHLHPRLYPRPGEVVCETW